MLTLLASETSPYARKVRIVADILGVVDKIAVQPANTTDPADPLRKTNPLGKMPALVLDNGEAVQGRVSVALGDDQAWVLWVREDKEGQSLWLSRRSPDLGREIQRLQVAKLTGRGKATGFPQLVVDGDKARIVWTDIVDGAPHLEGAIVSPAM